MKLLKNKMVLWFVGLLVGVPALLALFVLMLRWSYNHFFVTLGAAPLSVKDAMGLTFFILLVLGSILSLKEVGR